MSMLSCRVLCLLLIVLYCVGVANANANVTNAQARHTAERLKKAHKMVDQTLKNKVECRKAVLAAENASRSANAFAGVVKNSQQKLAAKPTEVAKKKKKGEEFIKIAEKASEIANTVGERTYEHAEDILHIVFEARDAAETYGDSFRQQVDTLLTDTKMNMETIMTNAQTAAKEAHEESRQVHTAVTDVKAAVKEVKDAIKNLEAATKDPTVAGQQGQTEGTKTQQTEENGKDAQGQSSRTTVTVNIRGESLDVFVNDAANKSGMALHDSSSIPALLRVPPLLLLLFSVLGCMAVCRAL
ncbi:hypothetical protein LSM04_002797 [Trypanosoma melophagium]|uniref:uncharacterized protein n=1 Tax=Trypanosoma melophagium TaxID=715481 RepID=UPI003519FC32|nr:hypothetical protein LSM04_002797 [Trypanosoma melophagium]